MDLAKKHVSYRVWARHYETLSLAPITNLERTLGSDFNDETKSAWIELWSFICTVMIPAYVDRVQEMGVEV